MHRTMDLFSKALELKNAAAWARDFNITPSAFSQVKKQGRLSPLLAGNFALELNEDPEHWIAQAALEAADNDKDSALLTRFHSRAKQWRKR